MYQITSDQKLTTIYNDSKKGYFGYEWEIDKIRFGPKIDNILF